MTTGTQSRSLAIVDAVVVPHIPSLGYVPIPQLLGIPVADQYSVGIALAVENCPLGGSSPQLGI